ncbi:hypothetical protein B0H11DRAFT_2261413 [Mycena galericulata]|nr:hypothetical protein B0H11DRAFT_2261413 [Mycena galericulata]
MDDAFWASFIENLNSDTFIPQNSGVIYLHSTAGNVVASFASRVVPAPPHFSTRLTSISSTPAQHSPRRVRVPESLILDARTSRPVGGKAPFELLLLGMVYGAFVPALSNGSPLNLCRTKRHAPRVAEEHQAHSRPPMTRRRRIRQVLPPALVLLHPRRIRKRIPPPRARQTQSESRSPASIRASRPVRAASDDDEGRCPHHRFVPLSIIVVWCTSSTTSLPTGFSRTDKLDSLALSPNSSPFPPPPCSHPAFYTPTDAYMISIAAHIAKKAEFIAKRATRPFAKEGPGVCYNVASARNTDIALYRRRQITGAEFLARLVWKVGHTSDFKRRRRDYVRCEEGRMHIWVCRWEVTRRYYCERLTQLEQLCNGGELVIERCLGCGARHREYFAFFSVGGLTQFITLMAGVIAYMGEVPTCLFFDPSPDTSDIYNLILQS